LKPILQFFGRALWSDSLLQSFIHFEGREIERMFGAEIREQITKILAANFPIND
jgi:hypothetical protein